jgi:sugar (pentulose or hexulose) kinase
MWADVSAGVRATVHARGRIEPVPQWVPAYREERERYRALYPALRQAAGLSQIG